MKRPRFEGVAAMAAVACVLAGGGIARGQEPVFNDTVAIDQQKLASGDYTLSEVLRSGERFFAAPYLRADGWGEGPGGPRASQRKALYGYVADFPLLRVNGLDSQSCFECHLSIGMAPEPEGRLLRRKPGATAGAAGIASTAMINDEFPTRLTKFLRNPPHAFGSGYVQELAGEMSLQLKAQRLVAREAAMGDPGITKSILLEAKGIGFGVFRTTYNPVSKQHVDDYSAVKGVAEDLVVRPFQWKGIASDLRNFCIGALDFHFGLQPVEKEGIGMGTDPDGDGKQDEVTVGNVSALVAFVGMTRPPHEVTPEGKADVVQQGRRLFEGLGSPNVPVGSKMCAECHTPSLILDEPIFRIEPLPIPQAQAAPAGDAPADAAPAAVVSPLSGPPAQRRTPQPTVPEPATPSLINPTDPDRLPINREFERLRERLGGKTGSGPAALELSPQAIGQQVRIASAEMTKAAAAAEEGQAYEIDLTTPDGDPGDPGLSVIFPRLPAEDDGRVEVKLYSDLRTHDMGLGLTDVTAQPADARGVAIPPRHFLTRPLWGVADTGPYLHDGRALSLNEAILGHAVRADVAGPIAERELDPSSEAYNVVRAYKEQLTEEERQAILEFLSTLRLPADPPAGTP